MFAPHAVLAALLCAGGPAAPNPEDPAAAAAPDAEDHDHAHDGHEGQLGPWPMSREVSGTAWQPDSSPMPGLHFRSGAWSFMAHGFVNAVYTDEPGRRGDAGGFGTGMAMLMGRRSLGRSALGFRVMLTGEPAIGPEGYPLLLQTGETADGLTPLIDRQHPHDMLMELAGTWSRRFANGNAVFAYLALAGEPPVGPAAFMHRPSGADNPLAPIGHHFLDSTHVAHGVATLGFATAEGLKLEAGVFNGREPDERRWNVQSPRFDSFAGRVSVNPHADWSLQLSAALLESPEQLHQELDVVRTTASVTWNRPLDRGNWQTTLAFGRNKRENPPLIPPGSDPTTHVHFVVPSDAGLRLSATVQRALLLESTLSFARWHSLYLRLEQAEKDELFPPGDPRHTTLFKVQRATLGYVFDFPVEAPLRFGLGLSGSLALVPDELSEDYGARSVGVAAFLRLRLGP